MVFPLYDNNPFVFKTPPYVNWGIIVLNVAIFLYTLSLENSDSLVKTVAVLAYAFTPAAAGHHNPLLPNFLPWEVTLVSYSFLHASWLHLIGNMAFLWVFGDDVEEAVGHWRYVLFYALCAAAGACGHWLSHLGSGTPLIGASGAVAGVVGAYLLLHPCRKIWVLAFMRIPLKLAAEWVIGFWLLIQLLNIFVGADKEVAWWTHIAGFAAGALLVVALRRPGVKLLDCAADRLLQNAAPAVKRWPGRVDTQ